MTEKNLEKMEELKDELLHIEDLLNESRSIIDKSGIESLVMLRDRFKKELDWFILELEELEDE